MYSNCLFWSIRRFCQLQKEWIENGEQKGYEPVWYLRSSRLAPWWVPSWGVERRVGNKIITEKFSPENKERLKWYQVWRKFWFKGYVEITYAVNK